MRGHSAEQAAAAQARIAEHDVDYVPPTNDSGGGGISQITVTIADMVENTDYDQGDFMVPLFILPAKSVLTVYGYSVGVTWDDSNGGTIADTFDTVEVTTTLALNDTTPPNFPVKSAFFFTEKQIALVGMYGDGTQGELTIFYTISTPA